MPPRNFTIKYVVFNSSCLVIIFVGVGSKVVRLIHGWCFSSVGLLFYWLWLMSRRGAVL